VPEIATMKAHLPSGLMALALLVAAPPARADAPERVRAIQRDIDQARFDEADAAVRAALESGELSPSELARVHLSRGVIAAARRESEAALAGFRRALSLDPNVRLPGSAGPHVAELFEQAKADGSEPLEVGADAGSSAPGEPLRLELTVTRDPQKIGRAWRVSSGSFEVERRVPPLRQVVEVSVPASGCADVAAVLVDANGNRVWSNDAAGRVCAAADGEGPPPIAPPPAADRPITAPVWVGITATGIGFAATTVLGLVALDRRSEFHEANADPDRTELERNVLRDDAKTAARTATIAAIATGIIGATTVTLFLLRPERSGPVAGISVQPGGARAVVGARF
jgi:hypothetical protein